MRVLWNTPRKKDLLMKCKNCGHEVNENDVYCSHCGTKLEKEETQVDEKQWYFVENNETKGPFSEAQMKSFIQSKRIDSNTYVWSDGFDDWKELKCSELKDLLEEKGTESIHLETHQDKIWYYVDQDSNHHGPFTQEEMETMYARGTLDEFSYVWKEGMRDWQKYADTSLSQASKSTRQEKVSSITSVTKKNIPLSVLFSFLTCGLYALYWMYTIAEDVNSLCRENGKTPGTSGGLVLLFSIFTCGIYGLYFWYKVCKLIDSLDYDSDYVTSDNSILCLVLAVIQLNIISMCIVQDSINEIVDNV